MRSLVLSILVLLGALAGLDAWASVSNDTGGESLVINNGLAPPNPANVVTEYVGTLFIRNEGCPVLTNSCVSPGADTTVEFADNGGADSVRVYDSSHLLVTGGLIGDGKFYGDATVEVISSGFQAGFSLYDSASILFSGGGASVITALYDTSMLTSTNGDLFSASLSIHDDAAAWISGGTVPVIIQADGSSQTTVTGGISYNDDLGWAVFGFAQLDILQVSGFGPNSFLGAHDDGIIRVHGSTFEVDGVPVSLGPLSIPGGTLTGIFESGDPFSFGFGQGGLSDSYFGTIVLVPEPTSASLLMIGCLALGIYRRTSTVSTGAVNVLAAARRKAP